MDLMAKKRKLALSLMKAGVNSQLICKAASLSNYQLAQIQRDADHFHNAA